jgi:hypothetical protein
MKLKLGQACYTLDMLNGQIIESTYGGHDWTEDLGLVKPTKHELEAWLATIRNEVKRRNK